jgi:hypothetical protein
MSAIVKPFTSTWREDVRTRFRIGSGLDGEWASVWLEPPESGTVLSIYILHVDVTAPQARPTALPALPE